VLSHFSTAHAVANYSVTVQIWAPLVALIAAAARPLWPMFTQARVTGQKPVSMTKVIFLFCSLAAIGGAVLFVISGPVANIIGGDQIDLGIALPLAMAIAGVVQAAAVPLAMALMYPAGLRLIATLSLICVPLNVGLSIIVAPHLGAPGPLYVSIVIATFLQTIPAMVHLHRHGFEGPKDRLAMAPIPAAGDDALAVDGGLSVVGGPALPAPSDSAPAHLAPADDAAQDLVPADLVPLDLEALVTDAVERALADPTIHLHLAPTVLRAREPSTLDGVRRIVARIDRQAARLEGVADQLAELGASLDDFSEVSRTLIAHQEATDPPPGTWAAVQRGDDEVHRSLDDLVRIARKRLRP
jgi:hypothetical protein